MRAFTALTTERHDEPLFTFLRTTLDRLVDAPVYAGLYWQQFALST